MREMLTSYALLIGLAAVTVLLQIARKDSRKLPPGPRKLPLVENLFDIPTNLDASVFRKMALKYGSDIIHLSTFGQSFVVLDSVKAAEDLLDKRSTIYSSRAKFIMLVDLCGWGWLFTLYPYGTKWREERRAMIKNIGTDGKLNEPKELFYSRRMIVQMLNTPRDFLDHIRHMVGSIFITTTYGLPVKPFGDPNVKLAHEAANKFEGIACLGPCLPDIVPLARYLPSWVPGLQFPAIAEESKKIAIEAKYIPFDAAVEKIRSGEHLSSFVSTGLEDIGQRQEVEEFDDHRKEKEIDSLRNVAATLFTAGSDTTTAVLSFFMLAISKHSEIQKKAQVELDRVLQGRLPVHEDLEQLPYLLALILETYRWKPIVPVGLPHSVIQDDIYEGYYIPKDSTVIPNQESMLYNEVDYPEPHTFDPERFLKDGKIDKSVRNPMDIAFGFGRRICPGRSLAHSTIMMTAATILSMLSIEKIKDEHGHSIEPIDQYIEGIVRQPVPFECTIKPRSKAAEDMIRLYIAETGEYSG